MNDNLRRQSVRNGQAAFEQQEEGVMKKRFAPEIAALAICLGCALPKANSQAPDCAHILFCRFNQDAAANDPTGIQRYSRDLTGLILAGRWTYGRSPSGRTEAFEGGILGKDNASNFADRLAKAEQAARIGNGKLIPEAKVAQAFDDLMRQIRAPSSERTDEAAVRRFREHAAALHAFSALFSADRNGANCNPGEAVFLLYLLISENGVLHDGDLDRQVATMQMGEQQHTWRPSPGPGRTETPQIPAAEYAWSLLRSYPSGHGHRAAVALYNNLASTLGI